MAKCECDALDDLSCVLLELASLCEVADQVAVHMDPSLGLPGPPAWVYAVRRHVDRAQDAVDALRRAPR